MARVDFLTPGLTELLQRVGRLEAQFAELERERIVLLMLQTILTKEDKIMADLTALTGKVADLEAEVAATRAQGAEAVQTLVEIKALLDAAGPGNQVEVDALTGKVSDAIASLQSGRSELDTAEEAADPTPDTP